nr:rhomboid family intramembrane serine protease [Kofleriaceae bacterium]
MTTDKPASPAPASRREPAWTPWVTYALIAANLAAFAYEIVRGASATSPTAQQLFDLGANFGPVTLHGEPWRLGTAMFLHFGLLHVGMNMVCLYQGRIAERAFGRLGFAALYVSAGLIGGVASLARTTPVVSAGASGAVFGVFGAFAAFLVLRRKMIERTAWQSTMRSIAIFVGLNLVLSLQAGIDMSAHVGGLVGGAVCAWILVDGDPARAAKQAVVRALGALAVGVVAVVLGLVLLADRVPARDLDASSPDDDYTWLGPTGALVDEFYSVDRQTVAAYNDAIRKARDGSITNAQFADSVTRDVMPPLTALRAKLDATAAPDTKRALVSDMASYLDLELHAYGDMVAASTSPDNSTEHQHLTDYKATRAAADVANKAFLDELQRLSYDR